MRTFLAVIPLMILTGCFGDPVSDSAGKAALKKPMTRLAVSLAGDDVSAMRRDGRTVIATYDAWAGPQ